MGHTNWIGRLAKRKNPPFTFPNLLPDDDNAHEEISEYNSGSSKDKQKNSLMEKSRNRMYWKSDAAEGADTKAEEQNLEDDFDDSSALEIDVRQKNFKNLSQTANFH